MVRQAKKKAAVLSDGAAEDGNDSTPLLVEVNEYNSINQEPLEGVSSLFFNL